MTPSNKGAALAYYITPHGFGHAVRSLEVIRRLLDLAPSLDVIVVSDLPEFLIEQNVGRPLRQRRRRLDVGLVQNDSLQYDLEATLETLGSLKDQREILAEEEARFLATNAIRTVVADVPFLAFAAASKCGVRSIGVGNFTWDWIYKGYARLDSRWEPLVQWIGGCYGLCDLFLQLPMHGDCSVCPNILDVPLVARKARRKPEETRRILNCAPPQKAYLVSFVALDMNEEAQRRLEAMEDTVFFYKRPLSLSSKNARSLDDLAELSYADVIAAMDAVITKPGYGIVSDCLANSTPIVYSDRGFFPEYGILVEEIERSLTAVHLPSSDLYSGNWEAALGRVGSLPRRTPHPRVDGADFCARIILRQLRDGRMT